MGLSKQRITPSWTMETYDIEIRTIDHLEVFTEGADAAAARFCTGFGFTAHGRGGPDTGRWSGSPSTTPPRRSPRRSGAVPRRAPA
ncbi:hypothetical protein Are01nite_84730 [Actinoplanes regularis]|nr:hypothetical protein Are01nite_84730 [Actinoplanes regularis]